MESDTSLTQKHLIGKHMANPNHNAACLEANNGDMRLRNLEDMTDTHHGLKTIVVTVAQRVSVYCEWCPSTWADTWTDTLRRALVQGRAPVVDGKFVPDVSQENIEWDSCLLLANVSNPSNTQTYYSALSGVAFIRRDGLG